MDMVEMLIAFNSLTSLVIIYFLLPLWKLKGQIKGIYTTVEQHEDRILSLEEYARK